MKWWFNNPIVRAIADIGAFVLIVVGLAYTALTLVALEWVTAGTGHKYPLWLVVAVIVLQNTLFVGYVMWRLRHRDNHAVDIGLRPGTWLRYSIIGVPLVLSTNIVVALLFLLAGVQHNQSASFPLTANDIIGQWVFLVAAGFVAPLGEEIVFRGYILGKLRQWLPTTGAIGVSALLFAGAHAYAASTGAIVIVVGTFALGVVLGWLRTTSQSLWPAVLAHMVNNGLAVAATTYCINHPEMGCTLSR